MAAPTDARVVNLLGALSVALADRIHEAIDQAAGARSAAPAALVALDGFLDGGSIDRLHDVVGLTPSGAVRLVDRLEADGLVERRPGRDRRSVALVLTTAGRAAAQQTRQARASVVQRVLEGLHDDDTAELARILEQLLAHLTVDRLAAREAGRLPRGGWLCRLCDLEACGREQGACPAANATIADTEVTPATGV